MWTRKCLLVAAAVAIAPLAAGCKPDPVKPKVTEPKASTRGTNEAGTAGARTGTETSIPPGPPASTKK